MARLEIINGIKHVFCVLLHIEHVETCFQTFLNFVQLMQDENGVWEKNDLKELRLKNLPTYCSLEPRSKALVLCTDHSLNLSSNDTDDVPMLLLSNIEPEEKPFSYTWSKVDEDIFIKFKLSTRNVILK